MTRRLGTLSTLLFAATACADDPVYLGPDPVALEINAPSGDGPAFSTVVLPFRLETEDEILEREALATRLGLTPEQVPQVRRDQLDVSVEWSVKNLEDRPGTATVTAVGANEYFLYDPLLLMVDPTDDDEEPPPPLLATPPFEIPAGGMVTGVFREDELAEAAQDWDGISRAGVVPQFAMLTQWETGDVTGGTGGELAEIPAEAVAALLRLDVTVTGDRHLVLEYQVRVRDHSRRLEPAESDPALLVPPSETAFAPPEPAAE